MRKTINIDELKKLEIWINWKYEQREGKNTKLPLNPHIENSLAKTNDPSTWGSFDDALGNAQEYDVGVGIMFAPLGDGFVLAGIDIDAHNVDRNPLADEILETFRETYIEKSPSAKGYHVLFALCIDEILSEMGGTWDKDKYYMHNHNNDVECYVAGATNRYFTFTGNTINGNPLVDMTDVFKVFLDKYMQRPDNKKDKPSRASNTSASSSLNTKSDIDEVLEKARRAKDGAKFVALYDCGDTSGYNGDDSAADMALCTMLAWWLRGDYAAIDEAFRRSRLYRQKWEREDYRSATINKAIALCNGEYYTESGKRKSSSDCNTTDTTRSPFVTYNQNGNPIGISATQLARFFRENEHFAFIKSNGDKPSCLFYDCVNGVYKIIDKNLFLGEIKKHIEAVDENLVKSRVLEEAYKLLVTDRARISADELNINQDIINFTNGVLKLSTMEMLPHSPEYLSTNQIPCDYNPNAGDCPVFKEYLRTLANGDKKIGLLLWEYLGLAISNIIGSRTKAALFLYGKSDTGKSQYIELIYRLVGAENFASVELKNLEDHFGTFPLLGKRVAGCGEMGEAPIRELANFKKITGNDLIAFEQKGRDAISAHYNGVLLFASNVLPKFGGDKGDAVYNRMIIVPCENVVPKEARDDRIVEKFLTEREAIVAKAIVHLRLFIERGCNFDEPEVCGKMREKYRLDNEPILDFINDCAVPREKTDHDLITTRTEMYEAYCRYSAKNNFKISNRQEFRRALEQKGITDKKIKNTRCYSIELTSEARAQYLFVG